MLKPCFNGVLNKNSKYQKRKYNILMQETYNESFIFALQVLGRGVCMYVVGHNASQTTISSECVLSSQRQTSH